MVFRKIDDRAAFLDRPAAETLLARGPGAARLRRGSVTRVPWGGTCMLKIQGSDRRELLRAAGTGLFGLSLPRLLAAESAHGNPPAARAKSVIFIFLFGGPSQLETFDMKPNAPSQIRGPFKPTASRTPGLLISEHLQRLAAVSDRFCVVRTMTHNYNDHSGAGHYLQTGKRWHIPIGGGFDATPRDWPSIGSSVEY